MTLERGVSDLSLTLVHSFFRKRLRIGGVAEQTFMSAVAVLRRTQLCVDKERMVRLYCLLVFSYSLGVLDAIEKRQATLGADEALQDEAQEDLSRRSFLGIICHFGWTGLYCCHVVASDECYCICDSEWCTGICFCMTAQQSDFDVEKV